MDFDVVIIGAGPGGMNCALYAARAGLKTLLIEGLGVGGQLNYTAEIDNYLGFLGSGTELAEKMRDQTERAGVLFSHERVNAIVNADADIKIIKTRRNEYRARAVVIATGANPRKLGIDGEERLLGAGVSYCATCDGAMFKDKTVVVAGGGNTAFEEALYLSKFSKMVYLVHRREKFRANASLVKRVKENPKIQIRTNETVEKIQGDNAVKSVVLKHTLSSRIGVLDTDGVFVAIGRVPETGLVKDIVALDDSGYIITDANMRTSIRGIYAVGDVRNTPLRQVITAAADGAVAANDISAFLE